MLFFDIPSSCTNSRCRTDSFNNTSLCSQSRTTSPSFLSLYTNGLWVSSLLTTSPAQLDFSGLSHVAYFGVELNADASLSMKVGGTMTVQHFAS